mmetsp:Transcript_35181/g.101039  ORF Transcript_35181/g.101039 Transcript_35181/m.101039 type:complete len:88 (+) Transcript_35181:1232-1495(+)
MAQIRKVQLTEVHLVALTEAPPSLGVVFPIADSRLRRSITVKRLWDLKAFALNSLQQVQPWSAVVLTAQAFENIALCICQFCVTELH